MMKDRGGFPSGPAQEGPPMSLVSTKRALRGCTSATTREIAIAELMGVSTTATALRKRFEAGESRAPSLSLTSGLWCVDSCRLFGACWTTDGDSSNRGETRPSSTACMFSGVSSFLSTAGRTLPSSARCGSSSVTSCKGRFLQIMCL